MFLQIFLLFLLYFPLQIFNPSFCADFDDEDKKIVVAEKLAELTKLTFKHSPNFFFSSYHIGEGTDYYGAYFVDKMTNSAGTFHEEMTHPNIDIQFGKNEKTGNLDCTYNVWNWEWSSKRPDEYKEQIIKERDASGIDASKKTIYVDRIGMDQPQVSKDYFQTIPLFFTPPGIAPPANRVENAEFLNSMNVHNILRICSAAYFYRGYSPDKEKVSSRLMRDDWFLYLLEGKLECNFEEEENANQNGDELLAKGFEVLLYEMNDQMYNDLNEGNENPSDCAFEALLSKYSQEQLAVKDIPGDGFIFHLAGIFGSAQLDNKEKSFWKWKKTGTKDGRDIYVIDDRWDKCTKNYGHFDALRIEFHHKCTKREEGEKLICSIKKLDGKSNFGIFDYKEFLNETVKAHVDLANQKLIMPDGKQFECVRKRLKGN